MKEVTDKRTLALAQVVDLMANGSLEAEDRRVGFILMIFPLGQIDRTKTNCISNGMAPKDMAILLRAMAAHFEGQPEQSGSA
jgi:hypothetical protein